MESPTYTVPSTTTATDSTTGVRYKVKSGEVITMQRAVNLGLPGAALPGDRNAETQPRTATTTGAGAGTIADPHSGSVFVPVTSDDANKIIVLPTPTPGTVVALSNGATGYELRSSAPATVGINGGTGANAESAIPANTLTVCACRTSTAWLCTDQATDGSVVTTEVAAA